MGAACEEAGRISRTDDAVHFPVLVSQPVSGFSCPSLGLDPKRRGFLAQQNARDDPSGSSPSHRPTCVTA